MLDEDDDWFALGENWIDALLTTIGGEACVWRDGRDLGGQDQVVIRDFEEEGYHPRVASSIAMAWLEMVWNLLGEVGLEELKRMHPDWNWKV